MPIAFGNIPPNQLVPFFYAEVTTQAQPISPALRVLLIGQKNVGAQYSEGTALPNVPYLLTGDNARTLFGAGSVLYWMYERARANAPFSEIWGATSDHSEDATRGFARLVVTGVPSSRKTGFIDIYINGHSVTSRVFPPEGATTVENKQAIRDRLLRAINANPALPCVAQKKHPETGEAAPYHTLYLVSKFAGTLGNENSVSLRSPRGKISALARYYIDIKQNFGGGAGEINLLSILNRLGDMEFDIFVTPSMAGGAYNRFSEFMQDRWSPQKQLYGHVVSARKGTVQFTGEGYSGGLIQWAEALNDPHLSVIGYRVSEQPSWEWSSALAGVMSVHWVAPPELSRPLQTLELSGLAASWQDDEPFDTNERQALLSRGVSTWTLDNDGTIRVERVRTLRKYSDAGELDPSWADAITMFQAQYFVRFLRRAIVGAFPRAALSTDDLGIEGFASAEEVRQVILLAYDDLVALGLVENAELFAAGLVVERNAIDRNRLDCYVQPDMVNQLRVVAVLVETHLELIEGGQIAA